MKKIICTLSLLMLSCASFGYTIHQNTGDFTVATSLADWSSFDWEMGDYDDQYINVTFDQALTNGTILFRMAYPKFGNAYFTISNGAFSTDGTNTSYTATIIHTNLPPPNDYYSEFLYTSASTQTRTLAKGMVETIWSAFSATNSASWTPVSIVYSCPPEFLTNAVNKTGDTMTGNLSAPSILLGGTTNVISDNGTNLTRNGIELSSVDSVARAGVSSNATDIATNAYAITTKLSLSGGTMSGAIAMGEESITGAGYIESAIIDCDEITSSFDSIYCSGKALRSVIVTQATYYGDGEGITNLYGGTVSSNMHFLGDVIVGPENVDQAWIALNCAYAPNAVAYITADYLDSAARLYWAENKTGTLSRILTDQDLDSVNATNATLVNNTVGDLNIQGSTNVTVWKSGTNLYVASSGGGGSGDLAATNSPSGAGQMLYSSDTTKTNLYFASAPSGSGGGPFLLNGISALNWTIGGYTFQRKTYNGLSVLQGDHDVFNYTGGLDLPTLGGTIVSNKIGLYFDATTTNAIIQQIYTNSGSGWSINTAVTNVLTGTTVATWYNLSEVTYPAGIPSLRIAVETNAVSNTVYVFGVEVRSE